MKVTPLLTLFTILITLSELNAESIPCNKVINLPSTESLEEVKNYFGCEDLKELDAQYASFRNSISFPIRDSLTREELRRRESELEEMTKSCQNQRFEACFSHLNTSIREEKLNTFFSNWIKDERFRYHTGGGACEVRAKSLAHELAQLGFEAKQIRIGYAPTLIAMERDEEGLLNGNFYDYGGSHSLIQIMVEKGGEKVPYLLDPQFMNTPVPRDQYFIQTIGQVCQNVDNHQQVDVRSYLNCYFSESAQNSSIEKVNSYQALNNESMACGWHFDVQAMTSFAKTVGSHPTQPNPKRHLAILNGDFSDLDFGLDFQNKDVHPESSKELILAVYVNLSQKFTKDIKYYEEQNKRLSEYFFVDREVEQSIEQNKKQVAQLKKDLAQVEKKLNEVRFNLGFATR